MLVFLSLVMMRQLELLKPLHSERQKGAVRAAIRYILATPSLRIAFVILIIIGTLGYNFNVELPLFVERSLHEGDAAFTLIYACFSLGALVSALVVAHNQLVHLRNVLIGAAAFGASLLLLAATPTLAIAVPVMMAVEVASILYSTATTAIVQVDADPSLHGRILAIQAVLLVGTTPIGGPIDGAIADAFGARVPLLLGGIAALAAALWGVSPLGVS